MNKTICKFLAGLTAFGMITPCISFAEGETYASDAVSVIEFEDFEGDFVITGKGNDSQADSDPYPSSKSWWIYKRYPAAGNTSTVGVVQDYNGNSSLRAAPSEQVEGTNKSTVIYGKRMMNADGTVSDGYSDKSGNTKLVVSFDMKFEEFPSSLVQMQIRGRKTDDTYTNIFNMVYAYKRSDSGQYWLTYAGSGAMFKIVMTEATIENPINFRFEIDLKEGVARGFINGTEYKLSDTGYWPSTTLASGEIEAITGIRCLSTYGVETQLDNYKVYTVPTSGYELSASQAADNTNMPLSSDFEMTFNGFVDEDTLDGITVTAGGTALAAEDYEIVSVQSASGTNAQTTVTIKPAAALQYGTDYVVSIPATVTDETGNAAAAASFTYTTEAAPSFTTQISATTGFAGTGDAVTSLSDVAGKSINVAVTAQNTTGGEAAARATSGTVFAGLYDADGNVISYSSVNKNYDANASKSMSFSLAVPADASDLQIKAFVCKDIFDLTPLSDVVTIPWTAQE